MTGHSDETFDPKIVVTVKDADGYLVEGTVIKWTKNGRPYGRIDHSEGQSTLTVKDRNSVYGVTVEYEGLSKTRALAIDQNLCQIVFSDLHTKSNWKRQIMKHYPSLVGIFFILLSVFLGFYFQNPNTTQNRITYSILALGCSAFAGEIPGLINVKMTWGKKVAITATGAMAIFVIVYLISPAR